MKPHPTARPAPAYHPVAASLSDLVKGAWRRVAVSKRGVEHDLWDWDLDSDPFHLAKAAGSITTGQQRQADGKMWLLAQVR